MLQRLCKTRVTSNTSSTENRQQTDNKSITKTQDINQSVYVKATLPFSTTILNDNEI